ncbi:MAG: hypothetical protein QW688_01550 [Thermoprotei archaeon]
MYEYKSCSIFASNADRVPMEKTEQRVELYTQKPQSSNVDQSSNVNVDCEFFVDGECRVMHRKLMQFEVHRCAQYSHLCPLREKALKRGISRFSIQP